MKMYTLVKPLAMLFCSVVFTGCAAMGADPLEPVNRQLQAFNNGADKVLIKPLAMGYATVMPDSGERAVQRFFQQSGGAQHCRQSAAAGPASSRSKRCGAVLDQ